ncbi:DUF6427 family protein [Flavobacteriaceae bacterium MHTCC 0001]
MITSIFNKSKAINLAIVFIIISIACAVSYFNINGNVVTANSIFIFLGFVLASYFSLLILNFVTTKNNLTKTTNFEIVLYGLFLLLFPQTTTNLNLVLANIFLLFGVRRLLSLRLQSQTKKKLFDAAFWLTIVAVCYSWTVLFLVLIPIAVHLFCENKLRNWLVPVAGSASVFIIAYSIFLLLKDSLIEFLNKGFSLSLDFSMYNTAPFLIGLTLLLAFGIWSFFFYSKSFNRKKKALRPSFNLIAFMILLSFLVVIVAPDKTGGELLFMFAPLAIIIASYIETVKEAWFKELFFAAFFIVPIVLLIL